MGKKVNCSSEEMDYNYKASKDSASRTIKSSEVETDYSIEGKKRSRKDFD